MTEPVAFDPTMQKNSHDCAVACLKMLADVDYQTALAAFPKRAKVTTTGASDRQLINAARKLGYPLVFITDGDLSEIVGILQIIIPKRETHAVMLIKGAVYDPAKGQIWTDIDAFLASEQATVAGVFIVRRGKGDKRNIL